MNFKKYTYPDNEGKVWGIISLEEQYEKIYAIKYNKPENKLDKCENICSMDEWSLRKQGVK